MIYDHNSYMTYRGKRRCRRCGRPAMCNDALCGPCHNAIVMATLPRYVPTKYRKQKKEYPNG